MSCCSVASVLQFAASHQWHSGGRRAVPTSSLDGCLARSSDGTPRGLGCLPRAPLSLPAMREPAPYCSSLHVRMQPKTARTQLVVRQRFACSIPLVNKKLMQIGAVLSRRKVLHSSSKAQCFASPLAPGAVRMDFFSSSSAEQCGSLPVCGADANPFS